MDNKAIRKWVKKRDAALLSLDKERIQRFCMENGTPIPKNEKVFWAGVHKAIVHMNAATEEQKQRSFEWLLLNGFSPFIN